MALAPRFEVSNFIPGDSGNSLQPRVSALPDSGGFVVVWHASYSVIYGEEWDLTPGVYARVYDASGVAQGSNFLVNVFTQNAQRNPDVLGLSEDRFIVIWDSFQQFGPGFQEDLYGRLFGSSVMHEHFSHMRSRLFGSE